jgi:hypothetical protein
MFSLKTERIFFLASWISIKSAAVAVGAERVEPFGPACSALCADALHN